MCVCFVDLDIVPKPLPHSHTSCLRRADKREEKEEEGGESQREKEVRRRGQETSFPEGNGAKVKKKICSSTQDRIGYGYQSGCHTEFVHSVDYSFIKDVFEADV